MITLIEFIFRIVDSLLGLLEIAVIVNAVVSWLVAFQVINMRNQAARSFVILLDRLTRPFLAPFRRFIPPIGGLDITPVLLIIVIQAVRDPLLVGLYRWLILSFAPPGAV